ASRVHLRLPKPRRAVLPSSAAAKCRRCKPPGRGTRVRAPAETERRSHGPRTLRPLSTLQHAALLPGGRERQHADSDVSALSRSGERLARDLPDGGQLPAIGDGLIRGRQVHAMIAIVTRGLARLLQRVRRLPVQRLTLVSGELAEQDRMAAARRRFWAEVAAGRRLADEARRGK